MGSFYLNEKTLYGDSGETNLGREREFSERSPQEPSSNNACEVRVLPCQTLAPEQFISKLGMIRPSGKQNSSSLGKDQADKQLITTLFCIW